MSKSSVAAVLGAIALAAVPPLPAPASAHHSFATYDMMKTAVQAGTIKEFRWGAPHSSMILVYKNKAGKVGEMSFVSGSPLMFTRQGFAPRDFKPGQRVTVGYHPFYDGMPGGAIASVTLENGRTFSDSEVASKLGK